jgi:hypothetical protein
MVLEVAGEQELGLRGLQEPQQPKLPASCEWLCSSWSSWFQTQPQLMYDARRENVFDDACVSHACVEIV